MRVLHLITRMDGGGSAVNTLLCATHQAEAGYQVCLAYGPDVSSDMSEDERTRVMQNLDHFRAAGGKTYVLDALHRQPGLSDWRACRQIAGLIGQRGFDLVHTHTSKAGALGRWVAFGRVKAVVHTPHGHIFHGYFGSLKTRLFAGIERWLARRTHALVALTGAERDDHLRLRIGELSQWHVIPSGVDVAAIAAQSASWRQQHGEDEPEWTAVSVGRLVEVKGMDRLIRAWKRVVAIEPEARLAIVGDGPERVRLGELCHEHGVERQVHFAGWQNPVPFLVNSRCFVLLSRNEGMGRVVVEAMAVGLPCVVSGVCGLGELVDPSVGRIVDAEDSDMVADAVMSRWPESVQVAARKRAECYSLEVMTEKLSELYEEVMHGA
ncbi:MAG TPA: glycosyltransferase [Mariprofundaceae bacterium]|nr:glycosyltransferase [Mariprofundaceae bacterium]